MAASWSTADDWDNAASESGVTHRNFGTLVDGKVQLGPDHNYAMRDWFGCFTSRAYYANMPKNGVYDATSDKTFLVWSGPKLRPFVTYYDHSAGRWGPIVRVSTSALSNDDHGIPQIEIDGSGYLHVFWGAHNNPIKYAISTSPRDISAWTAQADVSTDWAYYAPFIIGGNIRLMGRRKYNVPPEEYRISTITSSGVATGHGWGSVVDLVKFDGRMMYPYDYVLAGTDIHFVFVQRTDTSGPFQNVYYAVFDTVAGNLKNAAGSTFTLPVNETTGNASFMVFNSGSDQAGAPLLWRDSSGNPHTLFTHDNTVAGAVQVKHGKWTGSAWDVAVIETGTVNLNQPGIITTADTLVDFAWRDSSNNIKRTTFNPTDNSGVTTSTLLAYNAWGNPVYPLAHPRSISNPHPDLRLLLSDYRGDVWDYEFCRIGAWGDSGFLQAEASRHECLINAPLDDAAGVTTLADYSGHDQGITRGTLVSGATPGINGRPCVEFASGREGTIAHSPAQWIGGSEPFTIRFFGRDLDGIVISKGRPASNTLRYWISVSTTRVRLMTKNTGTFFSADSSPVTIAGIHLYEIVWDGAGTTTFRQDGVGIGTSTGVTVANMGAQPTTTFDVGYGYSSGSNAATKSYATGKLQWLQIIPRHQSTLAEHQAMWDALVAGELISDWKAA